MKRKRNKEAGFTLMELMVVVVAIGIMSVLFIPKFKGVIPFIADSTAKRTVDELNKMASEKVNYWVLSGNLLAKETDLGSNLEEALATLKEPVEMGNGSTSEVGGAKSMDYEKINKLGIGFVDGEFIFIN